MLPKSVDRARISANFNGAIAAANVLTDQDIAELDGIAAQGKQKRSVELVEQRF